MALAVGHGFLWGGLRDPFGAIAARYGSLPGDSILQYKFAYHLWNNLSTVQFYSDWNGSDRPPLQSGILLLTRPFETAFGIPGDVGFTDVHAMQWGIAAGIVAQLIWIPGMYALLRALRFRSGVAVLTIAFVSVLPLAVWNTTYTWPKMMSAGFALAALAVLVTLLLDQPRHVVTPLVVSGVLTMLAFLSHGGAAFVAPALILLALLVLRGRGTRQFLGNAALNLGVGGLLYLPWILYGRYADPNHSRLLKWHFAGVIAPDDRPFLPTLVDAYRHASTGYLVEARKANLARVFDHNLSSRLHPDKAWPDTWRSQDFFSSTFAIGLGTLLLVGVVIAWIVAVMRRRRTPREMGVSVLVIAACFACMVAWTLVLFFPDGATVHVGTYVWLLVFAALSFAWTARWSLGLAVVVAVIQATYAAVVYRQPNPQFVDPHFSIPFALVLVTGALGLTMTTIALIRSDRRPRRAAAHAVESVSLPDQGAGLVTS